MSNKTGNIVKIVVVDDEEIVLSLIQDALEDEDYHIRVADNGLTALEMIEDDPADLILTDIRMPQMDGIELISKVRQYKPETGVIFMTGYANLNSAKDAIKQGAFDYIMKPFELSEIRQAVDKAVKKIQEESIAKNSGQQLAQLSNLNQMLVTVGDHSSLSTVSLRFAMIHCKSTDGTILYWDRNNTEFRMITISNDHVDNQTFENEKLTKLLSNSKINSFNEPVYITSIDEHPLFVIEPDKEIAKIILPNWYNESSPIIAIPIRRADTLYGLIMTTASEAILNKEITHLGLLGMAANQLALSLENLFLLEETQKAYSRLKELQDETISLEKMATKGEISAEIGHELNNFLGVVAGNFSLLDLQIKKKAFDKIGKYTEAIYTNIDKMKRFTDNLMDLTSISSQKEIIFFNTLLTEVIDYLKPQKRFRNVTIQLDATEDKIQFESDSTHIQQLLYNIFNNAADATAGCKERTIKTVLKTNHENNSFTVTISDTGSGIEPEILPQLFKQKFTTKVNGHGFGLMVCKRIVDSHGGNLKVESTPGIGTTFRIEFPMINPEQILLDTIKIKVTEQAATS
ncbi:MAG: response regulator [bacterium]